MGDITLEFKRLDGGGEDDNDLDFLLEGILTPNQFPLFKFDSPSEEAVFFIPGDDGLRIISQQNSSIQQHVLWSRLSFSRWIYHDQTDQRETTASMNQKFACIPASSLTLFLEFIKTARDVKLSLFWKKKLGYLTIRIFEGELSFHQFELRMVDSVEISRRFIDASHEDWITMDFPLSILASSSRIFGTHCQHFILQIQEDGGIRWECDDEYGAMIYEVSGRPLASKNYLSFEKTFCYSYQAIVLVMKALGSLSKDLVSRINTSGLLSLQLYRNHSFSLEFLVLPQ